MRRFRRLRLWLIITLPFFAIAAGFLWHTNRTLEASKTALRTAREIRFTLARLDRGATAFEPIASTSAFRDAAAFQEKLYLLSSDSLYEHSPSGELLHRYSTGIDLPAAPLIALATGTVAGSAEPELFIATAGEGLVIFNGRGFRQVRAHDPQLRKVSAMLPLDSGQLVLGTDKAGVVVWNGRNLSRFHDSLDGAAVTALAGKLDSLWIGTLDRGLLHLHAGQLDRFNESEGVPDAHILSLATHGDRTWAGTALGIAEFRAGKFERSVGEGVFANTMLASEDRLAAGTLEEGIVDIALHVRTPRPSRPAAREVTARVERLLRIDGTDYAVLRDGLYSRTAAGHWTRAIDPPSALLTDNNIAALAAEPDGRLWIGYFDRGIDVLDAGATRAIHHEDEHLFCVNKIVPRRDGAVIATANGLVLASRDGKPRSVLTRADGLIASHVTDVVAESGGMIAATPAGLTFLTPAGAQSIYAFHGLVNNHVYALAQKGNRILAGTLGGVSVLESGIVKTSFTTANSALRHNWVTALIPVGDQWFAGTYGAGIYKFDGSLWHSFPDFQTGFEVNPNAMAASDTAVYAGTLGRGLAIYNRANGRWSLLTSGLPSSNITAVSLGGGYLYIGSDNGLVRISERSLPLP